MHNTGSKVIHRTRLGICSSEDLVTVFDKKQQIDVCVCVCSAFL